RAIVRRETSRLRPPGDRRATCAVRLRYPRAWPARRGRPPSAPGRTGCDGRPATSADPIPPRGRREQGAGWVGPQPRCAAGQSRRSGRDVRELSPVGRPGEAPVTFTARQLVGVTAIAFDDKNL